MTALGFLILAILCGIVGLGLLKLTPMYLKNMQMNSVMNEIQRDLSGQGPTPTTIREAFARRFSVEDINMDVNTLKITQSRNGYNVRVSFENKASYVGDIYLVVAFDKQVEIRR